LSRLPGKRARPVLRGPRRGNAPGLPDEGWRRIFRRQALAGQEFADPDEIAHATQVATAQLNARARPWIWGRPQPKPRPYRRRFIYTL
jgi:hypothetical protein